MKDALVRRTWITLSSAVIVGCLLALVSVQPAQARRWAMIDGIGPRPAFDAEDGVSFCRDGMQIGIALESAGGIRLQVESNGRILYDGSLRVDLPIEIGSLEDTNIYPPPPTPVFYTYRVSDYFRIPWSQGEVGVPGARTKLRFGPDLAWFKDITIGNCTMQPSVPTVQFVQIGPGSTNPTVSSGLVFEVAARDTEVGPNNGDGIYGIKMQVEDASGMVVFDEFEATRRFCAVGGDGKGGCRSWDFADNSFRWPGVAAVPIRSGAYRLVAEVHSARGAMQRFTKDIQIVPNQAKSYRTGAPPTIDGRLSEWGSASLITLDSVAAALRVGNEPSKANLSATMRSLWTSNTLYFAVSVTDDKIWNDGPQPWRDDEVEIGIDGLHDGIGTGVDDHQYTANPDGRQTDQGQPSVSFQVKTRTRIDGWDAEFAIPVGQLKAGNLAAGKVLGFNISVRDDDDGGDGDRQLLWAGTTTYRVEPVWGTLTLVDTAAPTVTPTPTGRPAATPTPYGDTITLMMGKGGYNGVQDTFISQGNPGANNSSSTQLRLRSLGSTGGALSSLLRFDLSPVPTGATVFRATLSLRASARSGPQISRAGFFPLKRDWVGAEATWTDARTGVRWQQPGALGANDAGSRAGETYIWTSDAWFSFDVTQLVQGWVKTPSSNYGLILRANPSTSDILYDFVASDAAPASQSASAQAYRPELIISYWSKNRVYLPIVVR